ncbi:MAG TPA: outer membrane lipoprotein carrier protein LolA [Polyangia bacterium]
MASVSLSSLSLAWLLAAAPTAAPVPAPQSPAKAAASGPAAAPAAAALSVDKITARMQERYDLASDYRAKFTQKYTYAATGRERTSTGEIFVKKPGRMRWNYQTPEASLWLANNATLWMYEPEAKQAFKQDLKTSQLPAAVAFLTGKGKLTDEFEVSIAKELPYGNPDDHRLSLKPKKAQSAYRSIYFVVDPKTFMVRQSVLINAQGDINAISFADIALNTKLADDLFRWSPPAGTRVIDGASMGASKASAAAGGAGPSVKSGSASPERAPKTNENPATLPPMEKSGKASPSGKSTTPSSKPASAGPGTSPR